MSNKEKINEIRRFYNFSENNKNFKTTSKFVGSSVSSYEDISSSFKS